MHDTAGWLASKSKGVRRELFVAIAFGEIAGLLLIVQTALLVRIASGAIFHGLALGALEVPVAALLLVILARVVVSGASRRAAFWCSASVKQAIRGEIVTHLAAVGPIRLIGERAGEIANTTVDGVEALDAYYARYLPQRAIASLLPLTVLAAVFPLDWISGVTLFFTALFIPVLMVLIGREAHERNQRLWSKISRMSSSFLDLLQGIATLKMFGAARREVEVIAATAEEYRTTTMGVMRIAFASALMLELVSTVSIAIVAITSGLRMLAGSMPFATGYFILLLAPDYFLTLRSLGTQYHARMEAAGAAEQILKLLKLPVAAGAATAGARASGAATAGARTGPSATDSVHGELRALRPPRIVLHEVSAPYPGADSADALHHVSLEIPPGARAAIVGPSGAGKSTLLSLLLGFLPPREGEVLIDGVPLDAIARRKWLSRVAWLPQRPTLFLGTVEENIRLARPDASREEVESAARSANADEFIRKLPRGYATPVGERGQGLSGGQIQRIALARLFLRPAEVLLLDEPTAHLDHESAALAMEAIGRLSAGKSVLFATHRLDGVEEANVIYVVESGRIVEAGSHRELFALGGRYSSMVAGRGEGEE